MKIIAAQKQKQVQDGPKRVVRRRGIGSSVKVSFSPQQAVAVGQLVLPLLAFVRSCVAALDTLRSSEAPVVTRRRARRG